MVERLACGHSPVHRFDPRVKIISALVVIFVLALLPDGKFRLFIPPAALVLLLLALARLPWWFVLSRTLMVLPFVLLVVVFLPWTHGQEIWWCAESGNLCIYREGLQLALSVALKGVLSLLWVELVVFTTPILDLLAGIRALGTPRVVVETLSFLFRYLDLVVGEGQRLKRARRARMTSGGRLLAWRSSGGLIGRIFLRALFRAERVWLAMQARGYRGELGSLKTLTLRPADLGLAAAVLMTAGAMVFLNWKAV